MARPRSAEREHTILMAAVRAIAAQGLGTSTATIAGEAGVSNGSLFTYFDTKTHLLNRLYLELKAEMAAAALQALPTDRDLRAQLLHMWLHWLRWATSSPEKRRTLAQLEVSDEITPQSHQTANQTMAGIAALLEAVREQGALREVPLAFSVALMSALADTTTDFMIRDPANAERHSLAAFEALWRMIAGPAVPPKG